MNMTPAITLADQRACVVREIGLRKSAYPKWVASGRLKQEEADRQLACMEAVLVTLDASADLLAALRWIMERTDAQLSLNSECRVKARAAIAKAEGKE